MRDTANAMTLRERQAGAPGCGSGAMAAAFADSGRQVHGNGGMAREDGGAMAIAPAADAGRARQVAAAAPFLETQILRDAASILALAPQWEALEASAPDTALFQSFAWCRNHLALMADNPDFRPAVVVLRKAGAPVALMPVSVTVKHGLRIATGMGEPFQQYSEWLVATGEDPVRLAPFLLDAIRSLGVDYLHFGQVREGGPLAAALAATHAAAVDGDAAPYVDVAAWADYESYLKSFKSKMRTNIRSAFNRLGQGGPVTHTVVRNGPALRAAIERAFAGRSAWLERLGLTSRAFRDDDFAAFIRRFAEERNGGIEAVAMTLWQGAVPVSDYWGFAYRGRLYVYMSAWNPDYKAFAPGRIHLGEIVRACFAHGWRVADFMIPALSYKLAWATGSAPVSDYVLPMSVRGRLHVELWLKRLRPVAKRLAAHIAPALRSRLISWFLPWVE